LIYGHGYYDLSDEKIQRGKFIAEALESTFHFNSVIDFGCGAGGLLSYFENHGYEVRGVERNIAALDEAVISPTNIVIHDLRTSYEPERKYDLATAIEVVEHIPSKFVPTLIQTFVRSANHVVLTAAQPGQGGRHHVNEQEPQYWAEQFEAVGWTREEINESQLRRSFDDDIPQFYADNLLVFSDADDGL